MKICSIESSLAMQADETFHKFNRLNLLHFWDPGPDLAIISTIFNDYSELICKINS